MHTFPAPHQGIKASARLSSEPVGSAGAGAFHWHFLYALGEDPLVKTAYQSGHRFCQRLVSLVGGRAFLVNGHCRVGRCRKRAFPPRKHLGGACGGWGGTGRKLAGQQWRITKRREGLTLAENALRADAEERGDRPTSTAGLAAVPLG